MLGRLSQNTEELAATLSDEVCCFHAFCMSLGCQLEAFLVFFLSVTLVQYEALKSNGNARKTVNNNDTVCEPEPGSNDDDEEEEEHTWCKRRVRRARRARARDK